MDRDPQVIIRELQKKLEEQSRGRQEAEKKLEEHRREVEKKLEEERRGWQDAAKELEEERRGRQDAIEQLKEEQKRRQLAESCMTEMAFMPYLYHCHALLFQQMSVQKVSKLNSSGGFTNVDARLYPRELRVWSDFPQLHEESFSSLQALFGDQQLFPSMIAIANIKRDLSPSPLAEEMDLRPFEQLAVELRAKDIIGAYLKLVPQETGRVIFRSNPYSLYRIDPVLPTDELPTDEPPNAEQQTDVSATEASESPSRGRSRSRSACSASGSNAKRPAESPPANSPVSKKKSPERRIVPDRWCIGQGVQKARRPLLTIEYKAGHKLTLDIIRTALDGQAVDLTIFPHAAKATRERLEKERLRKERRERERLEKEQGAAPKKKAKRKAAKGKGKESRATPAASAAERARNCTAQVLIQAYHYMIDSGLTYSYMTTGESLILLHVDYADPTVLYYHLSIPEGTISLPRPGPRQPVERAVVDAFADQVKQTHVSLVLTMVLLALSKMPLSAEAKDRVQKQLRPFPASYGEDESAPTSTALPLGLPPPLPAPTNQEPGQGGDPEKGRRVPAYLVIHNSRPAAESYCTQKCLLGLKLGLPLDLQCPNVALHQHSNSTKHDLSPQRLAAIVQDQLATNLDDSCTSLDAWGKYGAVGAMFKVTVQPYGYTLVAKGVQEVDRTRLDTEARAYHQLQSLQGRLVPVYFGLFDLSRDYILQGGAHIVRMMLLSYVGEYRPDIDDDEMLDLYWALKDHGVQHDDIRPANVLWSEELDRLMVIDFDHSSLYHVQTKRERSEADEARKLQPAKRQNLQT